MPLTEEQENALKGFRTYLNYLIAVRDHFRRHYGSVKTYYDACMEATRQIQGNRSIDLDYVRKYYKLAWNTEHLMHTSRNKDTDVQRLNNHWTPVQAYYSIYCACEATAYALHGQKPGSHSRALRLMTDRFKGSGLTPWCWVASGPIGKTRRDHRVDNLPPGTSVPHNLQMRDVDPIGMLALCLRAEHRHRVKDTWHRGAGFKYAFDPGDTSLLHFLYRLRIKANYDDVEIFLVDAETSDISAFPDLLCLFTRLAMMYLEVLAMRKIRKKGMLELANGYIGQNPGAEALKRRLCVYSH